MKIEGQPQKKLLGACLAVILVASADAQSSETPAEVVNGLSVWPPLKGTFTFAPSWGCIGSPGKTFK